MQRNEDKISKSKCLGRCLLALLLTVGGMKRQGLSAEPYQPTTNDKKMHNG
jgi:hypothetical protein